MTKARGVLSLQLGLAAVAASAVALALVVSLGQASWSIPSASTLLDACRKVVPDVDARSLAVLGLSGFGFAVIALTARSAVRRARASSRVIAELTVLREQAIGATVVRLFEHPSALAFCAGLVRPRIYVSAGAVEALSADELSAVVAHEEHHARQRDPLRMFAVRVLADGLFFAPALQRLADRYAALAELAADRAAVRAQRGDAASLASAMLAFERADPAVVGIEPERVDHLLGEAPRWGLPVVLVAWAITATAGVAALAVRVEMAQQPPVSLPLLLAEFCMVLMAIVPAALIAAGMLGTRRVARRLR